MNPFTDPSLTCFLHTHPSHVDGAVVRAVATAVERAFGDAFTEIQLRANSECGSPLQSGSQIAEVYEDTKRVLLTSSSRDVVLNVARFVGRFTRQDVAIVDVELRCLYEPRRISLGEVAFALCAELVDPHWGVVHTAPSAKALRGLFGPANPREPFASPPFGLPLHATLSNIESSAQPSRLAWINYWSPATCALLGFPDPARDADLLTRSRQLATGGWVVKLTADPLDPAARPDHVRALVDAYARFPQIGRR